MNKPMPCQLAVVNHAEHNRFAPKFKGELTTEFRGYEYIFMCPFMSKRIVLRTSEAEAQQRIIPGDRNIDDVLFAEAIEFATNALCKEECIYNKYTTSDVRRMVRDERLQ